DVTLGEEPAVSGDEEPSKKPRKKAKKDDDDEENEDKKPVKAGGRGGAWVGGTLIGALGGAGACTGLVSAEINMRSRVNKSSTAEATRASGAKRNGGTPGTTPTPQPVQPAVGSLSALQLLRSGELDKAAEAGIDKVEENKPEQLAVRGEY